MSAIEKQVGGNYYKHMAIQPYEFFLANRTPHYIAAIIRRIHRHDLPGGQGMKDLAKIIHETELIEELAGKSGPIRMHKFIRLNNISMVKAEVMHRINRCDITGDAHKDLAKIRSIVSKLKGRL